MKQQTATTELENLATQWLDAKNAEDDAKALRLRIESEMLESTKPFANDFEEGTKNYVGANGICIKFENANSYKVIDKDSVLALDPASRARFFRIDWKVNKSEFKGEVPSEVEKLIEIKPTKVAIKVIPQEGKE